MSEGNKQNKENQSGILTRVASMRTKTFAYICIYVVLVIYIAAIVFPHARSLPYDADEISWFYHTRYFDLLKKGDITHSSWQSLDAYDHPPVSKYAFGAYLRIYFGDYSRIRENLRSTYGEWSEVPRSAIDMDQTYGPFIQRMRETSAFSVVLILLLLSLLTLRLTHNILIALCNALLLVYNEPFLDAMLRAVSDSHYLLLLCTSVMFFILYMNNRRISLLAISSILGALAFSSKLTGAIFFLIIPLVLCAEAFLWRIRGKKLISSLLVVYACGIVTWFIVNPTLYPSPIYNTYWFFVMRQSIMDFQMYQPHIIPEVLRNVSDKANAFVCTFINYYGTKGCYNLNLTPFAFVNLILFMSGLGLLLKRFMSTKDREAFFIVVLLYLSTFFIAWQLRFNWGRYFLPILLLFSTVSSCGLYGMIVMVKTLRRLSRL